METFGQTTEDIPNQQASYQQAYSNKSDEDLKRIFEASHNPDEKAAIKVILEEHRDKEYKENKIAQQANEDRIAETSGRHNDQQAAEAIRRSLGLF